MVKGWVCDGGEVGNDDGVTSGVMIVVLMEVWWQWWCGGNGGVMVEMVW